MTQPQKTLPKSERVFLFLVPWSILACLFIFIAGNTSSNLPDIGRWSLIILLVLTALWFIACFAGDAELKQTHSFIFAYSFTFGAFALLLTPFLSNNISDAEKSTTSPTRPPDGVVQLVRGCVRSQIAGLALPGAMQCPPINWVDVSNSQSLTPQDAA